MPPITAWPAWSWMWLLAVGIYAACKMLTWLSCDAEVPRWKQLAYLLAWPGMDCREFVSTPSPQIPIPTPNEWLLACAKTLLGAGILWGLLPRLPLTIKWIQAWIGMIGIVFTLHFGLFHLLSCYWRQQRCLAVPLMNWPIASQSLSEFWGRRWNLAFRDLTHQFLFRPLRRTFGAPGALLTGFLVSGISHDLVISWPSGGGWGLPTLYFLVQGMGLLIERQSLGGWIGLKQGLSGRVYTILIVVLPSPLLFHPAFLNRVILPFLQAIGAHS